MPGFRLSHVSLTPMSRIVRFLSFLLAAISASIFWFTLLRDHHHLWYVGILTGAFLWLGGFLIGCLVLTLLRIPLFVIEDEQENDQ